MPPTPPLKQIKNIKLTELHKLDINDLKKIDYQSILKDVSKKPDVAISLIAPIIAILFAFNLFNKAQQDRSTQITKIRMNQEKLKVFDEYNKAQADLEKFFTETPRKLTDNEFTDIITDIASKRGVQIESFSPTKNQNNPLYDLTVIALNATAKNYEGMWLFIHDIENSNLNIRINTWSGNLGSRSQIEMSQSRGQSVSSDPLISIRMEVAAVTFKK